MNCIRCYQEIPEGSKFCPYCGAGQPSAPEEETVNAQSEPVVQPEANVQTGSGPQPEANTQTEPVVQPEPDTQANMSRQPEVNTQYQDAQNYNTGYQETYGYGGGYQNGYQSGNYQMPPHQQDQGKQIDATPYLAMSIILTVVSTICCCIPAVPFGVVAIVYAAKINSAAAAGNIEEAKKSEKMAKIWLIVTAAVFVLSLIIYGLIVWVYGESAYYFYNYNY